MAFIAPTVPNSWSLTAEDKFTEYTKRFDKLAITVPSLRSEFCQSHAVVLWGYLCNDTPNALDAVADDTWLNINSQLIFQGVARSTTEIEILEHHSRMVVNFKQQSIGKAGNIDKSKPNPVRDLGKNNRQQWPAAEPCLHVEFTGNGSFN